MRLRSLRLQNFKRFTDLHLTEIPESARLVLLIGANGSGKSSVFDAFEVAGQWGRASSPRMNETQRAAYYRKTDASERVLLEFDGGTAELVDGSPSTVGAATFSRQHLGRLYGRSSLRVATRMRGANVGVAGLGELVRADADSPPTFIDEDRRLLADAMKYAVDFNHALRQPVFEGRQVDSRALSDQLIKPINDALLRVFGAVGPSPQMTNFREPEQEGAPVQYMFRKGDHEFPYDVLSFGEKQVFAVLLNLFVRRDKLRDAVIYIDELDLHLNTALQYSLLEEIVEHWLPKDSQLWTASHSLGFVRYASQSAGAVIFDFDALDFDQPHTLVPAPKDTSEILEVAVPRDYLPQLFAGKRLVYCEGEDAAKFNSAAIANTIFVKGGNKFAVFGRARDGGMPALIDRDYLTDAEITRWQTQIATLRILRYYSIENYLYHPDNLAESCGATFDRARYVEELVAAKREVYDELNHGIAKARDGYPFPRHLNKEEREVYAGSSREVARLLKSDDLATFYPVLPMKERATQLPQRQNLSPLLLARTHWFAARMTEILAGIAVLKPRP